jgi:hypothetical protein
MRATTEGAEARSATDAPWVAAAIAAGALAVLRSVVACRVFSERKRLPQDILECGSPGVRRRAQGDIAEALARAFEQTSPVVEFAAAGKEHGRVLREGAASRPMTRTVCLAASTIGLTAEGMRAICGRTHSLSAPDFIETISSSEPRTPAGSPTGRRRRTGSRRRSRRRPSSRSHRRRVAT